jgi:glycosyltransferase involved in cell wall biosynthesis
VNSNFTKENIFLAYGLKSEVCHLGVDTQLFHQVKIAKKIDVLFFGSPVIEEGYDVFEAALAISPVKWKIKTLQRKPNGKGVSDVELVRLINQSKVVVSLEHHHPFGINMIESGACGVPVVAVREGGYLDSVQSGKTGLLVRRDARALEQAINRLLSNPELRSRMSGSALKRVVEYWTWEKSAKRLEKYLLALSMPPAITSPFYSGEMIVTAVKKRD